jgi:hypothetical protein
MQNVTFRLQLSHGQRSAAKHRTKVTLERNRPFRSLGSTSRSSIRKNYEPTRPAGPLPEAPPSPPTPSPPDSPPWSPAGHPRDTHEPLPLSGSRDKGLVRRLSHEPEALPTQVEPHTYEPPRRLELARRPVVDAGPMADARLRRGAATSTGATRAVPHLSLPRASDGACV